MLKAVLFDLDGTLLPMDQDEFVNFYFSKLAEKFMPLGYEPKKFLKTVWEGVGAMMNNDGSCTNLEAFWKAFTKVYGEESRKHEPVFEEFYAVEFQQAKVVSHPDPRAAKIVRMLREKGCKVILATNPLFPKVATESRIRWAGMEPEDFDLYSTYEDYRYCKPNLDYFRDIMKRMDLDPKDCIMVGNDVDEDMAAMKVGMKVFLLGNNIINRSGRDLSDIPKGDFDALGDFLKKELSC